MEVFDVVGGYYGLAMVHAQFLSNKRTIYCALENGFQLVPMWGSIFRGSWNEMHKYWQTTKMVAPTTFSVNDSHRGAILRETLSWNKIPFEMANTLLISRLSIVCPLNAQFIHTH